MTDPEISKLFTLLEQFFPAAAKKKGDRFTLAWRLALSPYRYEDVKAAALAYARTHKYYPDLADLTAGLTQEQQTVRRRDHEWMRPYLDPDYTPHPLTAYAARHGVTVGQAMAALGVRSLGEASA